MSLQNVKNIVNEHSRKRTPNCDLSVDFESKKLEENPVSRESGFTDNKDSGLKTQSVLQTNPPV